MFDDDDDDEYQDFVRDQERYHGDGREYQEPDHEHEDSEYNEGKGINYVITFQPQLPPLQPNEKRRSNARAEPIKRSIYLHEKSILAELLEATITAIGRNGPDDKSMLFKIVNKELRTTRFNVTWSIARTEHKKMQLASVDDYDELVKQVCNKAKPVATLEIRECEREEAPTTTDGTVERNGNGESTGKKRKVTAEEEEMTGIIAQLHGTQRCSDQTCTSRYCFVGNATAKHIRLTPFLLNIWAAAIVLIPRNLLPPQKRKPFGH
ncbi:hypothetical protein B0H13DRAFT_1897408 [Mycena leptocephala]|nr:hypothetical protein B0H13DRAFT_1897408 [Mycena leptocephala]